MLFLSTRPRNKSEMIGSEVVDLGAQRGPTPRRNPSDEVGHFAAHLFGQVSTKHKPVSSSRINASRHDRDRFVFESGCLGIWCALALGPRSVYWMATMWLGAACFARRAPRLRWPGAAAHQS